jgi:universal stress protein A
MKTSNTKRRIAETVVGATIGGMIAGPVGAVAGGLVGNAASAHTPHGTQDEDAALQNQPDNEANDPLVHVHLKRILVPLDFSEHSRCALRFAREWAARFGSEICLLHVIEPMNTYGILAADPIPVPMPVTDLHEPARAELARIVQQEFSDSAKVSVQLRDGVPYDAISNAAREWDADLIIVATHGRTGLTHVLMGSTAERVVRHAPCPVLTVRRAR